MYRADDDYTPLAFDPADVRDLYFVRESGATGDPTGLLVATGGYDPVTYALVRASDRAAVGSWVGYTSGITSITPELGSYRNLEVLYTATDWNSDTDSVTFYINVGPPTPYPVTTHSGDDRITVQVPTDDIPASHDVQLRHSSDGGATYGSWADATMTEVDTLSTTVVTGLSAGAEHYFQLRYCVDSGTPAVTYCGGPSRATYGRVQDSANAPTFASNQATTLTLTNSELVPDVEYLTVTATDPDGGDVSYTAEVVDTNSRSVDYFMIDRHTGGISVTPRQGSGFISNNAFAPSTYTMTVTATAEDGNRATIDVTITTANDPTGTPGQSPGFFVNDLPSQKTISQRDLHPAYLVATGKAADPQGDTVSFGLLHTSTFTNNFVINRTNGRITIRPGARFTPGPVSYTHLTLPTKRIV